MEVPAKRPVSPSLEIPPPDKKLRDSKGFRMKRQYIDKQTLTAYEQLGGETSSDASINKEKTIHEEEAEGAKYIIDGRLRRVNPYYFTYLTYCKMRWRDRNLLDIFVNEFRDRDAEFYKKTIAAGQVTINKKPADINTIVRNGDLISHRCFRREPPVTSREIKIVHEDENIIAIDKPSGIPVHPTGRYRYNTVTKVFQHELGKTVHPCNRLDRLTSGLMFLGKNAKGADGFVQQIRDRTVKKEYIARVKGEFPDGTTEVDQPLSTVAPKLGLNRVDVANGKEAKTVYKKISYDKESDTSIVKCHPLTGRSHQIRVHLQYLGHPIANDPIYSNEFVWGKSLGKNNEGNDEEIIQRLDKIGKDVAASSWIHPEGDGETLSDEICEVSGMPIYSDPGPNDLDLWLHAYKYEAEDKSWSYKTEYPEWAINPQRKFMELAIEEAKKCGETQTQFNVGAVLVHRGEVLATGHSRELPGNTHAEQCALEKYFEATGTKDVPVGTEIYTTMEPCSLRLSGNLPCVDRILNSNIKTCFVGVVEPEIFVKNNSSLSKLSAKGVEYIHIPGYEEICLEIAKKGHEKMEHKIEAKEDTTEKDQEKIEAKEETNENQEHKKHKDTSEDQEHRIDSKESK
ncbi:DRAP deaminase [Suhomyces tanzawaensis NRRL Y-17324]|uniref:tRNA pseudouridine(32) synthase n=1 Tax=Suhomyces tanzawaensis NRRL Y-17324 TaxID=984487 RepID=A0A1E4SQ53_9ASCO|nr:DRAP deaminase [Suhomyces tanzawaensis NRRL Y-17324]ODV81625.1 DRAP deaminase [Suhomyces tanzawaensis NRRL Y-17324]